MKVLLAAALAAVAAAQPTTCSGTPNTLPIWTGQPSLVAKGANGLKFTAAPANVTPPVTVLHVYGTSYEMGYAYGNLMKAEINELLPEVMTYMDGQLNQSIPAWVPAAYRQAIIEYGLPYALELTYNATRRELKKLTHQPFTSLLRRFTCVIIDTILSPRPFSVQRTLPSTTTRRCKAWPTALVWTT